MGILPLTPATMPAMKKSGAKTATGRRVLAGCFTWPQAAQIATTSIVSDWKTNQLRAGKPAMTVPAVAL
jgi:hypothetical protein